MNIINTPPPLSLYIHIPWCVKKCPYCDFNSHQKKNELPEAEYIQALINDFKKDSVYILNRKITSIFLGGGTPSLFNPNSINTLLEAIYKLNNFDLNTTEITMESNPGTLEFKNFADYKAAGINRISLGVQSFQNDKLLSLGRIHNDTQVFKAIENLKSAGIEQFNIDLMYGLPHQTIDNCLYDLSTALTFSPPHLSWYNLSLEPQTPFFYKPPKLPTEDLIWEMMNEGEALLKTQFEHYETSNFAKSNYRCKHNVNYWEYGDYIGIGAGAHGKITLSPREIIRTVKTKFPNSYMQESPDFLSNKKTVETKDIIFEFMLNALRLQEGFNIQLFEERTYQAFNKIANPLKRAQEKGLLTLLNNKIKPTLRGKRFLNELQLLFLD
ncbi:MAG: yggW [Francisellaceae bacterium]|nr:yggW [Francisellaceae bacterium]